MSAHWHVVHGGPTGYRPGHAAGQPCGGGTAGGSGSVRCQAQGELPHLPVLPGSLHTGGLSVRLFTYMREKCKQNYECSFFRRHLKPHSDFIIPCLLLAAGAYCATSFELEVRQTRVCAVCREGETQDLRSVLGSKYLCIVGLYFHVCRFLPCTKFAADFNCGKRLQSTVDCFRDNFDSRGFLQVRLVTLFPRKKYFKSIFFQVANSAMTKCSVCRTPQQTYCALFKPSLSSNLLGSLDLNSQVRSIF